MICDKYTAKFTAKKLLEVNAIKLQPNTPFLWASGWQSPIYCDNRITLSYPKIRDFIVSSFVADIRENFTEIDVVAGVATGAIAVGALVANELDLPFVYVRPEAKKHGRQNQIEGFLKTGSRVLVIEDLISTGMSSINAVRALRKAEAEVLGMYAIFSYVFKQATDLFAQEKIILRTLSDYNSLLPQAVESGVITQEDVELLTSWRKNPSLWGQTKN